MKNWTSPVCEKYDLREMSNQIKARASIEECYWECETLDYFHLDTSMQGTYRTIILPNGERVSGIVLEVTETHVRMLVNGEEQMFVYAQN